MEAECWQSLLSIRYVKAVYFYIAQLYNNSVAVLSVNWCQLKEQLGTLHN